MASTVTIVVSAIDQASGTLGNIAGSLKGLGGAAAGIAVGAAAAGAAALAGGLVAAGAAGLSFNNEMEIVEARLNAFTKDAGVTADMLEMIRARAAKTPFAFNEMANATASLLPAAKASGEEIEELISLAEILAASNPAEGLEGAAFSLKEAMSGDMTSIVERFNLSRQAMNALKEDGVVTAEELGAALADLGLDADLVANLAETMSGRWSTFKDTLMGVAATATAPLFDRLSAGLGRVNDILASERVQTALTDIAEVVGGELAGAFDWLVNVGVPMAQQGWQLLEDSVTTFQQALAGDWEDDAIIHPLHRIIGVIGQVVSAFQEDGLTGALATLAPYAQQALDAVTESFTEWAGALWAQVQPQIATWGAQFGEWLTAQRTNLSTKLQEWTRAFVEWIPGAVTAFLVAWPGQLDRFLTWLGDAAGPILVQLGEWTTSFLTWVVGMLPQLLLGLGAVTLALGIWLLETAVVLGAHLAEWTVAFIRWAADLLVQLGTKLGEVSVDIYNWIAEVAAGVPGQAAGIGTAIAQGIAAGIRSAAGEIVGALQGAVDGAMARIRGEEEIKSPSRKWAREVGDPIGQGIAVGIRSAYNDVVGALGSITTPSMMPNAVSAAPATRGTAPSIINITVNGARDTQETGRVVRGAVLDAMRQAGQA